VTDEGGAAEPPPASSEPERLDRRLQRGAVDLDEVVAIARMLSAHLDAEHADGRVDGVLTLERIEVHAGKAPRLLPIDPDLRPGKSYVAPEAWEDPATPASDQFSMAAILYEATCGGRCFPGDDSEKIRQSITTGSRVPLAARVPGLADAIDAVFEKALSVDPSLRYANCGAFAEALVAAIEKSRDPSAVLVQKPTSNKPSSRRPPPQRWVSWDDDDEAPPPISWAKVLGVLVVLAIVAAIVASVTR
jgi:hypothetical protein